MEFKYFAKINSGLTDLYIDLREISYVDINKGLHGRECKIGMKNGNVLKANENLLYDAFEALENRSEKCDCNEATFSRELDQEGNPLCGKCSKSIIK